jgi:hypothetical protein
MKIVGKYVLKTETLRNWDICGSNVRLNRVFELNRLSYAGYPWDDCADVAVRRREKAMTMTDEGPSRGTAPGAAAKKRKLGTAAEGSRASDRFVVDLLETCAVPGETMSSPELWESSARMLKVTRGRWCDRTSQVIRPTYSCLRHTNGGRQMLEPALQDRLI